MHVVLKKTPLENLQKIIDDIKARGIGSRVDYIAVTPDEFAYLNTPVWDLHKDPLVYYGFNVRVSPGGSDVIYK